MKSFKPVYALLFAIIVLLAASCNCGKPDTAELNRKEAKFTLGVASYTFRKFTIDETLAFMQRLEITNLSLKSFHLRLDASDEEIALAVQKCKDAGINLYAGGVIYMTSEAEVDQAFDYASKAGMKMIVGVPNHELLPYVENKVKAYDIKLAIHNHGPGDKLYPSAESAYLLIKDLDPRMGLCIDIGHTKRIARDPSQDVKDFYGRVFDIHIKDVTRADHDGSTCEIGRGVIDIKAFLSDLIELEYDGIVAFEYEKDGDDPFAGFAESVGYVRGMLDALR